MSMETDTSDRQEQPVIELQNVEKRFGQQRVLQGIDLQVQSGQTLVIVGGSGQGKSVIIKLMLGLVHPEQGCVKVFGRDLKHLHRRELDNVRADFGVLFQNAALFDSLSVFDNVALPLRERTRQKEAEIGLRVMEKLTLLDLQDAAEKFPAQLSGGMRKRAGLARALMLDPKIVFFDEPTTGLDVHKSNEFYRLFYRLQKQLGYTAVIVSHDAPKIFQLADQVALLAAGKIQGCLPPDQFLESKQSQIRTFVEQTTGPLILDDLEERTTYAQDQP